jgi:hypothetical protein
VKWQNSPTVPGFQKQLQTALTLSVTFIWSYPRVGLNRLWFIITVSNLKTTRSGLCTRVRHCVPIFIDLFTTQNLR